MTTSKEQVCILGMFW